MLTFEATIAHPATETRPFRQLSSTSFPKSVLIDGSSDLP
jgi:hypothetical protein